MVPWALRPLLVLAALLPAHPRTVTWSPTDNDSPADATQFFGGVSVGHAGSVKMLTLSLHPH